MIPERYNKLVFLLIFLLGLAGAYYIGTRSTTPQASPTPTATPTPKATPKPTATPTPVAALGTLDATFTTDGGGPSNTKVPFANRPLEIHRAADGKLVQNVITDKDGKLIVKLAPGDYYIVSSEISYFGQVNFSIRSNQTTIVNRYIQNPRLKSFQ